MRHRGARAEERAAQVQAQDEVPVLDLHVPDLRVAVAADVVDEDVELAEALDGGGDERGGGPSSVTSPTPWWPAARRGDPVGGTLELGAVDVAQRELRALLGEALRNRAADPSPPP